MRAACALLLLACAGPPTAPSRPPAEPSAALSDNSTIESSPPTAVDTPLAITIDDLPFVGDLARGDTPESAVRRILASADGVPITGFFTCHGRRHEAAWRAWMDSPIEVANHTDSHRSIDDFPDIESWRRDVESCQRRLQSSSRTEVRYFRYPFLRTGADLERRDAGFAVLEELGLTRAPVSVDTSDWALARLYARERAPDVARAYIEHVRRAAGRYRALATSAGHPGAPQVLLIHANALAADHLGALLAGLREDGFRFVTLREALADPLYSRPDPYVGSVGMSWLYRVEQTPDAWRWDAAQLHAMRVRFGARAEREAFDLDAQLSVRRASAQIYVVTQATSPSANSLVVEMSDGALLFVDTPRTDEATRSLLEWTAARFGQRALIAINTRSDTLGDRTLREAGATLHASEALGPRWVIPGHESRTDRELLAHTRELLAQTQIE